MVKGLHPTALLVLELLVVVVVLVVMSLLLRVNNRVDLIPQTPHRSNFKLVANAPLALSATVVTGSRNAGNASLVILVDAGKLLHANGIFWIRIVTVKLSYNHVGNVGKAGNVTVQDKSVVNAL